MMKKSSRLVFRFMVVAGLVLAAITGYLIHKEQETLTRLLNPGENAKLTVVYSRWLELKAGDSPSWDRLLGWLAATGYQAVSEAPVQPGEYRAVQPSVTVFARSFRYPDKNLPAQLLELRFSGQRLEKIEAV